MGRESSHGTKELFNLPPIVLKARHLASGSAFLHTGIRSARSRQWDGCPLGLGLVVEINLLNFHVI